MALEVVNIAEDGYRPSEYEDDDYNGNFASRKVEVLNNFTGEIKTCKLLLYKVIHFKFGRFRVT